ncbi:helix-turn-helix domain-containing protein [Streptomyces sp. NPDC058045]|uniref:helix-turn-helix domain-containing protein n=1 Tax=Streptomyces sp. NPDC058045 TaxID=3346311 RepID=UPI0036F0A9E2
MSIGNSPEDDRPQAGDEPGAHTSDADDRPAHTESVGHTLRQARIASGRTVDDLSTVTRVRIPIVHAIEDDDFSRCGGDVYARGHIRSLANALGLDPAPLIARFDAEHGGRTNTSPATPMFEAERIRPDRRRPNWTAAMVAAIVAVIGFVGFTLLKGSDSGGSDDTQVAEGSTPATSKPAGTKHGSHKPETPRPDPTDSAIAAAPRDKVTVMVNATDGRSWISAKDHNGRLLFDGLLEQGQTKTFQDNQKIDLVLGDAGSIKLFVNGKKIDDAFRPGQVERLSYTKGDPQAG